MPKESFIFGKNLTQEDAEKQGGVFENKEHFNQETFPEIVKLIKSI